MKKFLLVLFCITLLTACGSKDKVKDDGNVTADESVDQEQGDKKASSKKGKDEKKELTFGDTFNFDGFKIQMGESYSITTIDNQFSDLNGKNVVVIPVNITNETDETKLFNMFNFSTFDNTGNKTSTVSTYFEDSVDFAGEMRSGASKDTNFYILYDADGDYYIEFSNFGSDKIEVKLPIVKE